MIPVMYSHFQINSLCCMYTCSPIHSLVPPNFYSSPLNKNVCYKPNKNSIFRYSHCCCTIFILTPYPLYIHFHQCLLFTECKYAPAKFPIPTIFVYIRSPPIKTMIPGGTLRLWCIHISQLIAHVAWIDVLLTLQLCNSKYITNIPASRHITVGS